MMPRCLPRIGLNVKACGIWVREHKTVQEREDRPPEEDRDPLFQILVQRGRTVLKQGPPEVDELKVCRRRGHVYLGGDLGWTQCNECGMWVRKVKSTEESEADPR
jgi:hypothetical protein